MTLLELAVRGVRNFSGFTRIPLKPGLNSVEGSDGSGKTTLWHVLHLMLVPNTPLLPSEETRDWGRSALTFQGNDGHTYYLAHQFNKGRQKLARHEEDKGFVPIASPATGENPVHLGKDPERSLWPLCVATTQDAQFIPTLPPTDAASDQPTAEDGAIEPARTDTPEYAARKRLDELSTMETATLQATVLESRMAERYQERTLLHQLIAKVSVLDDRRQQVEDELRQIAVVAELPENVEAEIASYLESASACRDQRINIDQEIVKREDRLEEIPALGLLSRPELYAGILLAGGAGVLSTSIGPAPGILVAYGLGTLGVVVAISRKIERHMRRSDIERSIGQLRQELVEVESLLIEHHGPLLDALQEKGFITPQAALGARQQQKELSDELAELESQIGQLMKGKSRKQLGHELTQIEEQISQIETQLQELSTAGANTATVRQEWASLVSTLDRIQEIPTSAGAHSPLELAIGLHPALAAEQRSVLEHQHQEICSRSEDLMNRFTNGEFKTLFVDGIPCSGSNGNSSNSGPLQPIDADMAGLMALAQHIAVVDALDPEGSFPLILDEPFDSFDAHRRGLVFNTLRDCAETRQVVLFTSHHFLHRPGDHVIRLSD